MSNPIKTRPGDLPTTSSERSHEGPRPSSAAPSASRLSEEGRGTDSQSSSRSTTPDQRITIRDKYDVVIRPGSPPFVTVVSKGQAVSPRPSAATNQKRKSQRESSLTKEVPFDRSDYQERIYSPVARLLTKENRLEVTGDVIARAIELFPLPIESSKTTHSGNITTKTTVEGQTFIRKALRLGANSDVSTVLQVKKKVLDGLWNDAAGHIGYNDFVVGLSKITGIAVHWGDTDGRVRTLRPVYRRPFAKTISGTDPGSDLDKLKRGVMRLQTGERGYVKVDAASALALACLAERDWTNFARVVAAAPQVIAVLLDEKKVGHGPIFTDESIWLVLAHAIPPLRAKGGTINVDMNLFLQAFENYLCFHNPANLKGPYIEAAKWAYQSSGPQADALANSAEHFAATVERLWVRLCPEDNPIRDILDRTEDVDRLDSDIAAYLLVIAFKGIDKHLTGVIARRAAYMKAIARVVQVGGAVPFDAAKGAISAVDGGITGSALGKIGDLLLAEAGKAIGNAKTQSNFEDLREHYRSLFNALDDNARRGRFVPGQRILTENEMQALSPKAARGPITPADIASSEGDSPSSRVAFSRMYKGINKLMSDGEFLELQAARNKLGISFAGDLKRINNHVKPEIT